MNMKLTVINAHDETVYCVLDSSVDYEEQLMEVFGFQKGCGFSVDLYKDSVVVNDYFHGEVRARFKIVSFKPSKDEISLNWNKVED